MRKKPRRRRPAGGKAADGVNESPPAEREAPPALSSAAHRATVRLLKLQELFATSPVKGFTLTELSRKLDVPKSSLLAILRTLREHGYLEVVRAGEYQMSQKAIELSRAGAAAAAAIGAEPDASERRRVCSSSRTSAALA